MNQPNTLFILLGDLGWREWGMGFGVGMVGSGSAAGSSRSWVVVWVGLKSNLLDLWLGHRSQS
ncbi:MAG: hypothetical protein AAGB46_12535 [Verrucomicrobiota bacterium]